MPFAAGAQAALQQGQARTQAMARDDLVAVGGTAVAPHEHAIGAGKTFPWRQVTLVGADGPQGQAFATGIERENDASFAIVVKQWFEHTTGIPKCIALGKHELLM